jgi:hypothetical protein
MSDAYNQIASSARGKAGYNWMGEIGSAKKPGGTPTKSSFLACGMAAW